MAAREGDDLLPVDPLHHPDLARLGRRLRSQLDDTLEAEQHAARAAALRRRSLRDILLEAEDRAAAAVITCSNGELYRGIVVAVGADHVSVRTEHATTALMLAHIVGVEVR